jgi:hypothetical protein
MFIDLLEVLATSIFRVEEYPEDGGSIFLQIVGTA